MFHHFDSGSIHTKYFLKDLLYSIKLHLVQQYQRILKRINVERISSQIHTTKHYVKINLKNATTIE